MAFANLKHTLATTPMLALPDFDHPFEVETDALGHAMGAVLVQCKHLVAFFSKAFPATI